MSRSGLVSRSSAAGANSSLAGGRVMDLEVPAGVREQREAGRVRLGKAVERERRDGVGDLVGGGTLDALAGHPRAELGLDLRHAGLAPLESEGPPELLGLGATE